METKKQTSKEYFKLLSILHTSLLSAQLLFAFVSFYLNMNKVIDDSIQSLNAIFQFIVPVFIIGAIMGSSILFKTQMKTAKTKVTLAEKLNDYRSAFLVRCAMLEAPAMFAIVCYFLTANLLFLGFASLIIIYFVMTRPSPENTINDLELDQENRIRVSDPNSVVID